ncbi:MAG: porin [Puniceicoccales bacterium]|jgi:hypothetical protein|nr:porin [Puniceicoccales bacterium]
MNQNLKTVGLSAVLAAAATLPSQADVTINQYLSIEGYVAASATFTKVSSGGLLGLPNAGKNYTLFDSQAENLDRAFVGLKGKHGAFDGEVSFLYIPDGGGNEAGILDAYARWSQNGFAVKVGKFLTNLGYEAFHIRDMNQLTRGHLVDFPGGYHTGIDLSYTAPDEKFSVGGAVLDSLFGGQGFYDGDYNLKNIGFEFFASFKPNKQSKIFASVGYDSKNDDSFRTDGDAAKDQLVFDFWGSYDITDDISVGAEYSYAQNKASDDGSRAWILFAKYTLPQLNRKFSLVGRISSIDRDFDDGSEYRFTLSPAYKYSDNLLFRAEVSHLHGSGNYNDYFFGLQAIFSF